ncbi:AbrB/MazE/SpoVT family DNA-binding domain-containing protein [bacterium]|nr:AbrB/MazE/SpoVT family DNA-binding domain-containing protein [candidate division CSSED10-310 bacterium]
MSRITSKGQVTIPKEIREKFGFDPGDEIQFTVLDGRVIVQKKSLRSRLANWVGAINIGTEVDTFVSDLRGSE